jgi:hypothetical protein
MPSVMPLSVALYGQRLNANKDNAKNDVCDAVNVGPSVEGSMGS